MEKDIRNMRVTNNEIFVKKLKLIKPDYTPLEEWNGSQNKILVRHNKCGTEWKATPNNLLKETWNGCPNCGNMSRSKTQKDKTGNSLDTLITELDNRFPGEFSIIPGQTYINNKQNIQFIHKPCGNIVEKSLVNIRAGKGCLYCNKLNNEKSKGVKAIEEWLDEHGYTYEREYKFIECKNKRVLPFDFKVFIDDENFILIEFDGERHFITYNKSRQEIVETQKRDNIKNNFCIESNYSLLRIPYNEVTHISDILDEFFKESSTTIENVYIISESRVYSKGIYTSVEYTQVSGNDEHLNKDEDIV